MKECKNCLELKPLDDFHKWTKSKDGRHHFCKPCRKVKREPYRKVEYVRRFAWRAEYKATKGCVNCKENDPVALDFHHLDPEKKRFNISSNGESVEEVKREIEKCVVICKNCHAKLEAGRFTLPV